MQQETSLTPKPGPRHRWVVAALAALPLASACATGVDVTDEELEALCADPSVECDNIPTGGSSNGGTGALPNTGGSGLSSSANGGTTNNNGGSGFNNGGTTSGSGGVVNGNGGTSGGPLQPLADGTCLDGTDPVNITYTERAMGATNQATMTLAVGNTGASFNLTDLTIRYWFTDDGVADFTCVPTACGDTCTDCGNIDYASQSGGQGLSGVTVTFGEEFGSNYGEIGFGSGGPVGAEGVETIQVRIHAANYANIQQANDFSFQGGATAAPNRNITPYVNGTQVGGCVPIPP